MNDKADVEPSGLTFWSFIDRANEKLRSEYGFEHQLATELLLTLNRASNIVTYDFEASVHRPHGWSWSSFRLLFVTWLAGPIEPKRAAELTGMSRAAVSNLSKTLISDGVLARTPDETDGRSVRLALTDVGHTKIVAVFRQQNDREHAWASVLTEPEQRILILLLNKLITDRSQFDVRGRN
ncbi:MarR family transcriptional regulator [Rhodococcus sp. G-MC3]|uniref:MarR family winged helix-turn-helix transcriptional regulator n=1 Tax=Rhodococcus sp. G-MC3 TaxID=3046209 RepID=UPI0024B954BE|nr:MarR family transcriptional regulator [Rhodococcus sp. G-MC3]MDJ0394165.1 MarR family transcriptional regulator [Rhodococcus sp. G-MC3]